MDIIIYIYDGLTALDAVGPYEVLSRLPGARVRFVARRGGEIETDTGYLRLTAEAGIEDIDRADVLVVPGSVVGFLREAKNPDVLDWIRRIHETTQWTTSVCTGSVILAAAGLLEGLSAASHWASLEILRKYGVEPASKRWVQNGKIVTAQGVSAGIDMALFLSGEIAGADHARATQLVIEYAPDPPFQAGSYVEADRANVRAAKKILAAEAFADLKIGEVVRNVPSLLRFACA
jgi:putative intracellular protease/amidase